MRESERPRRSLRRSDKARVPGDRDPLEASVRRGGVNRRSDRQRRSALTLPSVALRSRRSRAADDCSPSIAIVPWRLLRRPALGDCELVGKAGCASSPESESIFGKRSRMSEGLPPGACWPALVRLTPGGVGFCNRRGAAVWSAPARRLPGLLTSESEERLCCIRPTKEESAGCRAGRVPLALRGESGDDVTEDCSSS